MFINRNRGTSPMVQVSSYQPQSSQSQQQLPRYHQNQCPSQYSVRVIVLSGNGKSAAQGKLEKRRRVTLPVTPETLEDAGAGTRCGLRSRPRLTAVMALFFSPPRLPPSANSNSLLRTYLASRTDAQLPPTLIPFLSLPLLLAGPPWRAPREWATPSPTVRRLMRPTQARRHLGSIPQLCQRPRSRHNHLSPVPHPSCSRRDHRFHPVPALALVMPSG